MTTAWGGKKQFPSLVSAAAAGQVRTQELPRKGGATGNGYLSKQVGVTGPVILEGGPGNVPTGSVSGAWANIGTPRP